MPRGVKAKSKTDNVTVIAAKNGWLVTRWAKNDEREQIVFTDLGELLGFLEEELESS